MEPIIESRVQDPGKIGAGFNRVPVTLQFNKESGEFITFILFQNPEQREYLNKQYYIFHEAVMDVEKETVIGTADNYRIAQLSMLPMKVYERQMLNGAEAKINKKYPVSLRLEIVAKALAAHMGDNAPNELLEMNDYIDLVHNTMETRIRGVQNRTDVQYITIKEELELEQRQLAGGAHELHGPRTVPQRQ